MNTLKLKLLVALSLASTLVAPMASAVVLSGSLSQVNYHGNVTNYIDNTGTGTYNGVTDFNGSYLIDSTSTDLASSSNIGLYKVNSLTTSSFNLGGFSLGSSVSKMLVVNDYKHSSGMFDAYIAKSKYIDTATNTKYIWGVKLFDLGATVFNSDSWLAEPQLSNFGITKFIFKSINLTTNQLNFKLVGDLTYLKDPIVTIRAASQVNITRVPEPSTIALFTTALLAFGFNRRHKKIK